jgi:hypothetical protein
MVLYWFQAKHEMKNKISRGNKGAIPNFFLSYYYFCQIQRTYTQQYGLSELNRSRPRGKPFELPIANYLKTIFGITDQPAMIIP